jgi:G3E family GTPase
VSRIETKLREVNKYAPILRCTMSNVSMENVLNIRAFELSRVLEMDPEFLTEGDHQHDSTVYSVGFERAGDLNMERTNTWIAKLLQEKGVDIYRMKGVLSMTGCAERYVYQGVHMLFTGEVLTPWGDAPRVNRLIFIGKNLDRAALEKGFESCLENPPPA